MLLPVTRVLAENCSPRVLILVSILGLNHSVVAMEQDETKNRMGAASPSFFEALLRRVFGFSFLLDGFFRCSVKRRHGFFVPRSSVDMLRLQEGLLKFRDLR